MFEHQPHGLRRGLVLAVKAALITATITPALAQDAIEEIIVTAQKQMETLQDVPIAITAFSENDIDNILAQDVADVALFAPNVEISRGSTQPRYTIRGIGTEDFGIGADPAVGVYIDGVYVGRSGASKVAFNDIERIEILNGPQGTLFGRNAAAGAVQYITNKPVGEEQGWVRATLGNYDKRKLEGVYNLPLTDNLYWRTGALWNERDGHVDNVLNGDTFGGEDNWSLNTALAWYPNDAIEVIFRMEYDELDQGADPQNSATLGLRDGDGSDYDKVESDSETYQERDLFGASLHVDYETEQLIISSITAWREFDSRYREERDGTASAIYRFDDENAEDNKSFSQELRFTSNTDGRLSWTTGVNYFWEDAQQTSSVFFGPATIEKFLVESVVGIPYLTAPFATPGDGYQLAFDLPIAAGGFAEYDRVFATGAEAVAADEFAESIDIDAEYKSYAVYGDMTYAVHEDIDVTVGIRWTKDEKNFGRRTGYNDFGIGVAFDKQTILDADGNLARDPVTGELDPFNGELGFYRQKESWEEITPRVVVDYRIDEDVLTYVSYSEGYKAGGFNSAGQIEAPAFDPENVENWELGFKSSWLDYTLRVNGAMYFYDYKNLQALSLIPGACTSGGVDENQFETSDVEGNGIELSTIWIPTSGLTLSFNLGTLDAEYTRRQRQVAVAGECEIVDEKGESLNSSPELNYSVGINYAFGLDSGAELNFNAAYSFQEGNDRNSCKFVENNANGTTSVYDLDTVDGVFQITTGGGAAGVDQRALGTADLPFSSCSDESDDTLLNIRVVYISPEADWELSTYVTNVTDEDGDVQDPGGLGGSLRTTFQDGSPAYSREDPRLYGVEFKYLF